MQRLKIGVGAIEGVPIAVAGKVGSGRTIVRADYAVRATASIGELVDVVAEEEDEIRVLLGHVPVGAEVPMLPIGAGREGEAQPIQLRIRRGRRSGPADGTLL